MSLFGRSAAFIFKAGGPGARDGCLKVPKRYYLGGQQRYECSTQKRAKAPAPVAGVTLVLAILLASMLSGPNLGVDFSGGCSGLIQDGAGTVGAVTLKDATETPEERY
jgi:hypothetical protein